jgi:hypothetical protein
MSDLVYLKDDGVNAVGLKLIRYLGGRVDVAVGVLEIELRLDAARLKLVLDAELGLVERGVGDYL